MSDGGSKFTMIDAAHSNGKAAVLAADSFAINQSSLQGTVSQHSEAIESLANNFHGLEQQVKAMARVMASQNVQKLSENMKLAQDDLRRSLIYQITEKQKEIMSTVEREVDEVSDAKIGILKKIDQVENHIMTTVTARLDEAAASRLANAQEIDKMKDTLENLPGLADKTNVVMKQLEGKLQDLKTEFRAFVAESEQANREQDKETNNLNTEVRTALQAAKDKIAEETKSLSKLINKREELLKEEVKEVKDLIESESSARVDTMKTFNMFVREEVNKVKFEAEKQIRLVEGSQEFKVRPCIAALKELRRTVDEEACHRDTADKDLARRLAKEIQERHQDEERLVMLINTTQEAVTKLHKAQ